MREEYMHCQSHIWISIKSVEKILLDDYVICVANSVSLYPQEL